MTDWEDLSIPTPDGESLHAYFLRPTNKRLDQSVTVLMFHGNAGNIGHRLPIAKVIQEHMGCHVLMLEYRGYGLSTGTPNERGLLIDAQTGLDYLMERAETRDTKIVVYGQSLGGALSIQLAAKNEKRGIVAGLVLENTFTSMRKLIPRLVGLLLSDAIRHGLIRTARSHPRSTWLDYAIRSGLVIRPYLP